VFTAQNVVTYGYDPVSQLTSAVGAEADETLRGNEHFGYQYDAAGNLAMRTNNTLIQTFTTGNANQLVNISRNDSLTVAGSLTSQPNNLAINGQTATLYNDLTFAATNGVAINDGLNIFTAIVTTASSLMTNSLTQTLPVSVDFTYDLNGNLTSDGLHGYDYDCANELTRVTVTNEWKTEYAYDGFGRRRVRKEFVWQSGQWLSANEVHYIYDGMLVIQERNVINVPMVTYTRGSDLNGTLQGAGGIGGLLARTDANGNAYYHADGNGNITAMVNGSGNLVAK
jgi:YD repeat-containing protein